MTEKQERNSGANRAEASEVENQDDVARVADTISNAMQIEMDKMLYGTAFTLDGKRLDPTKVEIHRREATESTDHSVTTPPSKGGLERNSSDAGAKPNKPNPPKPKPGEKS